MSQPVNAERLAIPSQDPNQPPTLLRCELEVFANGAAIGVFKEHPENKGAPLQDVRQDVVGAMCDPANLNIEPRNFKYLEDQRDFNGTFVQRTFDKDAAGHIIETRPQGTHAEITLSPQMVQEMRDSFAAREASHLQGQEWAKETNLPLRPELDQER